MTVFLLILLFCQWILGFFSCDLKCIYILFNEFFNNNLFFHEFKSLFIRIFCGKEIQIIELYSERQTAIISNISLSEGYESKTHMSISWAHNIVRSQCVVERQCWKLLCVHLHFPRIIYDIFPFENNYKRSKPKVEFHMKKVLSKIRIWVLATWNLYVTDLCEIVLFRRSWRFGLLRYPYCSYSVENFGGNYKNSRNKNHLKCVTKLYLTLRHSKLGFLQMNEVIFQN